VRTNRGLLCSLASLLRAGERLQRRAVREEWVLREVRRIAAAYGSALRAAGRRISVNLSGQSLSAPDSLQCFEQWVCVAPDLHGFITVEVTETAAIRDLGRVRGCMKRLQRMGRRFALDDFGAGAHSLCYLQALPVDAVKLDGMSVRDLTRSARSRATLRGLRHRVRRRVRRVAGHLETLARSGGRLRAGLCAAPTRIAPCGARDAASRCVPRDGGALIHPDACPLST
jgi:EAL domain-containing protein (putative c-di-GMP-specific phosphodiesterase class I)